MPPPCGLRHRSVGGHRHAGASQCPRAQWAPGSDVRVARGEDDQLVEEVVSVGPAATPALVPRREDLGARLVGALGGVDAAPVGEEPERLVVVPGAPHLQGVPFGGVLLAAVLRQSEPADQPVGLAEPAARGDGLELERIADADQLGAGAVRLPHEDLGRPVVHHRGLVHDQDVDTSQPGAGADLLEPRSHRARREAGRLGELLGGHRAQACPRVRRARRVPPDPARLHQRRLARPGDADDGVDAVPTGQQPPHRHPLLLRQLEPHGHLEHVDGDRLLARPRPRRCG